MTEFGQNLSAILKRESLVSVLASAKRDGHELKHTVHPSRLIHSHHLPGPGESALSDFPSPQSQPALEELQSELF